MKLFKNNQYGRSMVEMLGVLAIIGVLSVGGIAGYSKAMFKYKFNKTMDIITHVIYRIMELDESDFGGSGIYENTEMHRYGIMPECDVSEVSPYCELPLGKLGMSLGGYGIHGLGGGLQIDLDQEPLDACIAFLTSEIYKNVPNDWWKPLSDEGTGGYLEVCNGNGCTAAIPRGSSKINLTNTEILTACTTCQTGECTIHWVIREKD